jgi:hypothetical protein
MACGKLADERLHWNSSENCKYNIQQINCEELHFEELTIVIEWDAQECRPLN